MFYVFESSGQFADSLCVQKLRQVVARRKKNSQNFAPRKFLSDYFISSYTRNRLFWLLIRENFENITNDMGGSQQEKEENGLCKS
jgi:hypothetical protein